MTRNAQFTTDNFKMNIHQHSRIFKSNTNLSSQFSAVTANDFAFVMLQLLITSKRAVINGRW